MTTSNRLTIRLGNLAEPLAAAAARAGQSQIDYAREAIAQRLGVDHQPYQPTPPAAQLGVDARWAKERWQRLAKLWTKLPAAQQCNIVTDYTNQAAADDERGRLKQLRSSWSDLHRNQQAECLDRVASMALPQNHK